MSTVGEVVWVVENGCYSDRYLTGVYDSIESVIAHHPVRIGKPADSSYLYREGGWLPDEDGNPEGSWSNGLDWDQRLEAWPMVVEGLPQ